MQRSVELGAAAAPVVQRAGTLDASMQHDQASSPSEPYTVGSVQRAVTPTAPIQGELTISPVVQRDAGVSDVVQRGAETSLPLQRAAGPSGVVQRDADVSVPLQRDPGASAVVQRDAGVSAVVQRDGGGGLPVQRDAGLSAVVQRGAGVSAVVQRDAGGSLPVQLGAVVQRDGAGGGAVQGAVGMSGAGQQGAEMGVLQRGGAVGPVVQRVGVAGVGGQGEVALGPVVQRAVEAHGVAQRAGEPGVERPLVGELAVGGGMQAEFAVQRVFVGEQATRPAGELQREVGGEQRVMPRAELLWPPRETADRGSVVPLSSAEPLTVPEVQQPTNAGSVPPAVQRVVFDHPGLRAPSSGRTTPTQPTKPTEVQAPVEQPEERVLSWSVEDSFHEEPVVQRVESVRSVSLQQMFSGAASTQEQPTEQYAVQRDEAPAAEPTAAQTVVQTAPTAQAQAQAPAGGKSVSAAEVEELAKRLYEPLTAKLKAELWLDRERAGRVTDRW
ncbi:hypothetical protein [Kribbella monticola]|uniref:hypothetical protein n=1 Tax=Kribbella monticola TaxID=2185285 RepID=UPI001300940C|nr:hypothetical protein [Kribbella monticola]